MTTLNDGLNRIRDLVNDDIYKFQAGTGTDAVTLDDTELETPDSNTLTTPSIQKADKALQITSTINAVTGEGSAYSEMEIQMNSGTDKLSRVVNTPVTKAANEEYNYINNYFFKGTE